MMKKFLFLAGCLAVVSLSPAAAATVELKAGHSGSTNYFYHTAFAKMAELLTERSKGEIALSIFPDAQLGGEVKLVQSVRTGTLDITAVASGVMESFAKEYVAFSFPYLFKDASQADSTLRGPIGREFLDVLAPHGLYGLGFLSSSERNIYTTGKPIEKSEDVAGLKIRVVQSPGFVKAYETLGALPTPIPSPELYLALQYGTVDAGETSPDLYVQFKYSEVAPVYSLTRINYMPTVMVMNLNKLESLTPEQQTLVKQVADEAINYAMERYKDDYKKSLELIRSGKTKVIEPDTASFRATAPTVYKALLTQFPDVKPWLEKIQAATGK